MAAPPAAAPAIAASVFPSWRVWSKLIVVITDRQGWQTLVDTRFGDDYRDDWPGPWRAFDGNGSNYTE